MNRNRTWSPPAPAAPVSDDYLESVTVGERKPHNDRIRLEAYDPDWAAQYAQAAVRIRSGLGGKVLLLEHVGSTSVPGLAAKPIIDMVLAVAASEDEDAYVPELERAGFSLRAREPDWFAHRFFHARSDRMAFNLHVFSSDCEEIDRMLAFRDRLRSTPADRQRYEDVKRELAARTWKHVQNYADAKSDIVREILAACCPH